MCNRTVTAFGLFCLTVFTLILRLFSVAESGYAEAAAVNGMRNLTVGVTRGMIYDRNMLPLVNSEYDYLACVLPTAPAMNALRKKLSDTEFEKYADTLTKGSIVTLKTPSETDYESCEDIAVLKIYKRYSDEQLAPHIIGYLSSDNKYGASGAEKSFDSELSLAYGTLSLIWKTDALGRVLCGADGEVRDTNYADKSGAVLTLDSRVQKISEAALIEGGFETGAVVILDAANAQILAMASVPTFDCNDIAASLSDENSPFINRAITGYSVGSVFKLVTAAAALENGISTQLKYNCTGSCVKGGTLFCCHKRTGHGVIDMQTAFTNSCNTYFIELASRVGGEKLLSYARELGLEGSLTLMPEYRTDAGILPDKSEALSPAGLANFGFGQGSLFTTPLHMAACCLAAVNGGTYFTPTLYLGMADSSGKLINKAEDALPKKVISANTSKILKDFMLLTVTQGTGIRAQSENYLCGGKTATAETGRYIENRELLNSWFIGYFPYDCPQYIIAVIKENGSSGSVDAAPVFKKICESLNSLH